MFAIIKETASETTQEWCISKADIANTVLLAADFHCSKPWKKERILATFCYGFSSLTVQIMNTLHTRVLDSSLV